MCGNKRAPYFLLKQRTRINNQIQARELRVVDETGENIGVLSRDEALALTEERGLDLIEISPAAKPPVAKITDYGKWKYEEKKKQKETHAKRHQTETKSLQVKIGTGEHDLELKSKRAAEFLKEGHRVKLELFLGGRAKYLDKDFHKERLERILRLIPMEYKIAEPLKKSPKGLMVIIEKK